jgi:gamma-butyrobetaine dioxygenase
MTPRPSDLSRIATNFYSVRRSRRIVKTPGLQGGTMSAAEVTEFIAHPYARDALAVRRWDEAAKDPEADVPGFDRYRPLLRRVLSLPTRNLTV